MTNKTMLFPMKTFTQGLTDDLCGVKCLETIYDYYQIKKNTASLVRDMAQADEMTYIPQLLRQLAKDGLKVTAVSSNPQVFDLTWKGLFNEALITKLHERHQAIKESKWKRVIVEYILYLQENLKVEQLIISEKLIKEALEKQKQVVAFTDNVIFHQRGRRFWDEENKTYEFDDIKGGSDGHAVVVNGWDPKKGLHIVDCSPIQAYGKNGQYWIDPAVLIAGVYTLSGEIGLVGR
jgi:hypothetical protein